MTKGELIKALEPSDDEIELFRPLHDREGNATGHEPISRLSYFYNVSNAAVAVGIGQIVLE